MCPKILHLLSIYSFLCKVKPNRWPLLTTFLLFTYSYICPTYFSLSILFHLLFPFSFLIVPSLFSIFFPFYLLSSLLFAFFFSLPFVIIPPISTFLHLFNLRTVSEFFLLSPLVSLLSLLLSFTVFRNFFLSFHPFLSNLRLFFLSSSVSFLSSFYSVFFLSL